MKSLQSKWFIGIVALVVVMIGGGVMASANVTTVNLLTTNIASVEIDGTGFNSASDAETPRQDYRQALHGRASLYIEGDGAKTRQGAWIASHFVPNATGTYTFSVYMKGKAGDQWYLTMEEKGAGGTGVVTEHRGEVFTLSGDGWDRLHVTATLGAGASTGMVIRHATAEPFAVWVDQMQLEIGDEPTAWQMPIASKNLLLYNQATLAYDLRGILAATGGGNAPSLAADPSTPWEGYTSLKISGDGSKSGQGMYTWSTFVPDLLATYTASVYVKGTPGDTFYMTFEEKGPNGTGVKRTVTGEPFTLTTSDWERHELSTDMRAGQTLALTFRHADEKPFDVWIAGLQLEVGSQATSWVAPARPVVGTR